MSSDRGTRLPNGGAAHVDIRKLSDYCLNPDHPRGRHKARVFRDALGIGRAGASELRNDLLAAAGNESAAPLDKDQWGELWQIDIPIMRQDRRAVVRTIWIVRAGERVPRFVTCWVL